MKIKIDEIHMDEEMNSRGKIAPMDVLDLSKDIERQGGLIQPVVVMKYPEEKQKETGKKYFLVAGFRRTTAHKVLKWDEIEASVLDNFDEEEARFMNLNENLQRTDLTLMQEAEAIQKVIDSLKKKHNDAKIPERLVMNRLGKSRGWVQVRMMALKLPKPIRTELKQGNFASQTDVRDLYTVYIREGKEAADEVVRSIKDNKLREKKSVATKKPAKLKPKKNTKRHRRRPEIFEMQEHIKNQIGHGDITKALAWAAGEISNGEFVDYIASVYENYTPLEMR